MLANVDNVIQWLRLNKLESFSVSTNNGANKLVFKSEDLPFEENINLFRQTMELEQGGRYIIRAKKTGSDRDGKNGFETEFSNLNIIQGGQSHTAGVGNTIPDGYISRSEFDALWAQKEKDWELKMLRDELAELKAENKELKEPKEEFFRTITPYVAPVVSGLVGKFIPQAAGILPTQIGTLDVNQNNKIFMDTEKQEIELSDEDALRLQTALTNWRVADPDWLTCLEKVSQLAASGDSMYNIAKEMLLK